MKLIGYWLENLADEEFIAPQEISELMPISLREPVAAYLERGVHVAQYRGYSWCRYHCGNSQNGSGEFSDGEWVWPDGLAHYVRLHGTALPQEFIKVACANRTLPQTLPRHPTTSKEFWIQWCKERENSDFRSQLRLERAEADRRAERDWAARIVEEEEKFGISREECAYANCNSGSLKGSKVCAAHSLGHNSIDLEWFRAANYSARRLLEQWANYSLKRTAANPHGVD